MPFYWDHWEQQALAAGVAPHLASLGRELMRDVAQHGRDPEEHLGSESDGPLMLAMALRAPISAEYRFASDVVFGTAGLGPDACEALVYEQIARRLNCDVDEVDARLWEEKPALDAVYAVSTSGDVRALKGVFGEPAKTVSVEDMNRAIADRGSSAG